MRADPGADVSAGLVEFRGLSVRYGGRRRGLLAVDSVDLTIDRGSTTGLVGESGSGKSTLARAAVGLVPVTGGKLLYGGRDYAGRPSRHWRQYRRKVQIVFQDPSGSLNPRMSVGDALSEAAAMGGTRAIVDRKKRVLELLEIVGLPAAAYMRCPHQFSGGQRQRIAIARAIAAEPEVLILDEVTSALDVSVQAAILNMLRDLQTRLGLSYLFISHDLAAVRYMSKKVAVMYLGRIVENAPSDEIFSRPLHPYTVALMDSIPVLGSPPKVPLAGDVPDPRRPPSGCRFHPRCLVGPSRMLERAICGSVDPQDDCTHREHAAACHFAPTTGDASSRTSGGAVTIAGQPAAAGTALRR